MSLACTCYNGNILMTQQQMAYLYDYPSEDGLITSYIFPPSLVVFGFGGVLLCIVCFVLIGEILIEIRSRKTQPIPITSGSDIAMIARGLQSNLQRQSGPPVPLATISPVANEYKTDKAAAQVVPQSPAYNTQVPGPSVQSLHTSKANVQPFHL